MWLKNLKEWFVRTKVLKHLLLFTVVQIIVGVIWTKISYVPSVQLELVPLSTVWDAFLHQSNVIGGTLLGIFGYFVIQAVSGFYLAWIFLNKGLKASWFVHYGFDLLMFLLVFANV